MRLFVIIALFPVLASAQTIGDAIESAKELVLGTECERLVREAKKDTQIIIYAANKDDWDSAFRYSELAFQEILIARSYCEDEPEQLKIANDLLHDHNLIGQSLVCTYHAQETHNRLIQADNIIKDINGDWEEALIHADWASYHVEEAVKRCGHNLERVEALKEVREHTYNLVAVVRDQVESE